jgi:hypothetical protein
MNYKLLTPLEIPEVQEGTAPSAGFVKLGISDKKLTLSFSDSTVKQLDANLVASVAGKTGIVTLDKSDVGLSNVDNTSDTNKPISTATQEALNSKISSNPAIVAGTFSKITYDSKGLILSGQSLSASDIPTLNQNTTGTSSNVTGVVSILNGGTGATTSGQALSNLGAYPASNPSGYTSNTGTVTSVNATSPLVSSGGTTPSLSIPAATSNLNGYMSAVDKTKLDGVEAGAQVNAVTSVAGKTGVITLAKADVGLSNVDNSADSAKNVATAATLTTARTINGVSFDGSANITISDSTKQPLDADLTAIAALIGTSGLLRKTAGDTWTLDTSSYVTSSGVTSVSGTAPIVSSGGSTPAISISAATTSAAGSMSSADKTKLDGIAIGATANTGTVTSVGGTGTVSGLTLSGTVTGSGNLTLGGTLSLTSGNVTTALGYTPYNSTNPAGYITSSASITGTSANVTGTVAVANGGTGLTSSGPSGNVLTSNGTGWISSPAAGGLTILTYDNRATLRSTNGPSTSVAIVESLGVFTWTSGSIEIDDDETCFASSTGRWLLSAMSFDLFLANSQPQPETKILFGSVVSTATSLASSSAITFTTTLIDTNIQDGVIVNPSIALDNRLSFHARVSSVNTIEIKVNNPSATSAVLINPTTWYIKVVKA